MFADTAAAPTNTEQFNLNWFAAFKRFVSKRFTTGNALSADDLPEGHYRDLGLSAHRHDVADIRPLIILGPM